MHVYYWHVCMQVYECLGMQLAKGFLALTSCLPDPRSGESVSVVEGVVNEGKICFLLSYLDWDVGMSVCWGSWPNGSVP